MVHIDLTPSALAKEAEELHPQVIEAVNFAWEHAFVAGDWIYRGADLRLFPYPYDPKKDRRGGDANLFPRFLRLERFRIEFDLEPDGVGFWSEAQLETLSDRARMERLESLRSVREAVRLFDRKSLKPELDASDRAHGVVVVGDQKYAVKRDGIDNSKVWDQPAGGARPTYGRVSRNELIVVANGVGQPLEMDTLRLMERHVAHFELYHKYQPRTPEAFKLKMESKALQDWFYDFDCGIFGPSAKAYSKLLEMLHYSKEVVFPLLVYSDIEALNTTPEPPTAQALAERAKELRTQKGHKSESRLKDALEFAWTFYILHHDYEIFATPFRRRCIKRLVLHLYLSMYEFKSWSSSDWKESVLSKLSVSALRARWRKLDEVEEGMEKLRPDYKGSFSWQRTGIAPLPVAPAEELKYDDEQDNGHVRKAQYPHTEGIIEGISTILEHQVECILTTPVLATLLIQPSEHYFLKDLREAYLEIFKIEHAKCSQYRSAAEFVNDVEKLVVPMNRVFELKWLLQRETNTFITTMNLSTRHRFDPIARALSINGACRSVLGGDKFCGVDSRPWDGPIS